MKFVIYYDSGNEDQCRQGMRAQAMVVGAGHEWTSVICKDTGPNSEASKRAQKSVRMPRIFLDKVKTTKRNNGGLVWLKGYLKDHPVSDAVTRQMNAAVDEILDKTVIRGADAVFIPPTVFIPPKPISGMLNKAKKAPSLASLKREIARLEKDVKLEEESCQEKASRSRSWRGICWRFTA